VNDAAVRSSPAVLSSAAVRVGVIGAVVIAALVRLPFLFGYGVDDDEFYTLRNAENLFATPTPDAVSHFPVSFAVTRAVVEWFGLNAFGLRLFPVVAGVLAVWTMGAPRAARARRARRIGCRGRARAVAVAAVLLRPRALLRAAVPGGDPRAGRVVARAGAQGMGGLAARHRGPRPRLARAPIAAVVARWARSDCGSRADGAARCCGGRSSRSARSASCSSLVATLAPQDSPIRRVLSGVGRHGYDAASLVFGLAFNVTPVVLALAAIGAVATLRSRAGRVRVPRVGDGIAVDHVGRARAGRAPK
jgi:hypothetical protein